MRQLLTLTGVAAATLLVGVGAYVSQAEPASGTAGASGTAVALLDDSQSASSDATASATSSPAGATGAVTDDNGGRLDRDLRTEPGDDRDLRVAGDDSDHGYDDSYDADDDHGRGGDDDGPGVDHSGRGGDDDGPLHG
jgi:hypothetical protein